MNTPYFPLWRRKLAPMGRHTVRSRRQSPVELEAQCRGFLSDRARPPADGTRRRRRVFCLSRVFWCFLWQVLQPRTPAMVHKELLAFLIAHNFMRCLIAQAATAHQVCRTRISFKGAVDAARSFHQAMRMARSQRHARRLYRRLPEILARDLVPLRPDRHEPRAVKRRPKPYNRLMKPRHLYHEPPHRGKRIQKTPGRKPRLS